jgi:subtilisin family serine protease
MPRAVLRIAVAAVALVFPAVGAAARYAVGLAPGAQAQAVGDALVRRGGSRVESLAPLRALTVSAPSRRSLVGLAGVRYVERLRARRLAFVPNDPFVPRQWYLAQNRSYDAWTELPPLAAVRVAVIDSGIDATHPELASRIAAGRSFVGGSPGVDTQGHGTFVAGLIAAQADDGIGIAGLAPSAQLLVAKVVGPEQSIPIEAEAKAIRWAVARGARVINMSLGGLRDPGDPGRDTYSRLEADAVAYAVSKGVVIVAAVGNADQAPSEPWPYASWPSALPHVLGVSALARNGSSPAFSNRDPMFNDIAAPGEEILSTFPLPLTARQPACEEQGYSTCGTEEYQDAEGTSFAAPQVSAAVANMLATLPSLEPSQATAIVERTAVDALPRNGCRRCGRGRDALTGWGHLDATAALDALAAPLPPPDAYEPNDDAGDLSYPLFGSSRRVDATLDYWDDRDDVYRVYLRRGQRLFASYSRATVAASLTLWRPAAHTVGAGAAPADSLRHSAASESNRIAYRAAVAGWYDLQIRIERRGAGPYRLSLVKA